MQTKNCWMAIFAFGVYLQVPMYYSIYYINSDKLFSKGEYSKGHIRIYNPSNIFAGQNASRDTICPNQNWGISE